MNNTALFCTMLPVLEVTIPFLVLDPCSGLMSKCLKGRKAKKNRKKQIYIYTHIYRRPGDVNCEIKHTTYVNTGSASDDSA